MTTEYNIRGRIRPEEWVGAKMDTVGKSEWEKGEPSSLWASFPFRKRKPARGQEVLK